MARQTSSRVVACGAVAGNRPGLSTQVPAKPVDLTDGRTRPVRIGNLTIPLRHAAPKELRRTSAMVLPALRHLGQAAVADQPMTRRRRVLSARPKRQLLRDARRTTDWIACVVPLSVCFQVGFGYGGAATELARRVFQHPAQPLPVEGEVVVEEIAEARGPAAPAAQICATLIGSRPRLARRGR